MNLPGGSSSIFHGSFELPLWEVSSHPHETKGKPFKANSSSSSGAVLYSTRSPTLDHEPLRADVCSRAQCGQGLPANPHRVLLCDGLPVVSTQPSRLRGQRDERLTSFRSLHSKPQSLNRDQILLMPAFRLSATEL